MNGQDGGSSAVSADSDFSRPIWTRERLGGLLTLNVNRYAVFILANGLALRGTIRGLLDKTSDTRIAQFKFEMDGHVGPLVIRPEDVVGIFVASGPEASARNLMDSLDELSVSAELLGLDKKRTEQTAPRPLEPGTKVPMPEDASAGGEAKAVKKK